MWRKSGINPSEILQEGCGFTVLGFASQDGKSRGLNSGIKFSAWETDLPGPLEETREVHLECGGIGKCELVISFGC